MPMMLLPILILLNAFYCPFYCSNAMLFKCYSSTSSPKMVKNVFEIVLIIYDKVSVSFFRLKAKDVREHLGKWNVESILKQCTGPEVFARLKDYVYAEINGKDHNMLLLFYVFTLNVASPEKIIQVIINGGVCRTQSNI